MKTFAALSGLFIGAILLTGGYAMAYWHGEAQFFAPLALAIGAAFLLPVLYWLKAVRRLRMAAARILFAGFLGALAMAWVVLVRSPALLAEFAIPFAIFSAVWLVATLPLLRAGIRHRP